MPDVLQTQVDCTTAAEFLDALSPLGPYFKDSSLNEPWLFRGQGKDDPLVPSLFRVNSKLSQFTRRDLNDPVERSLAERDILVQFFEMSDKRGIALPDDSQQLRHALQIIASERGTDFGPKGFSGFRVHHHALSLVALAQHYGLPTRLLDWTKLSFMAAYFAGEGAYNHPGGSEPMVVWAFYFPLLGKHDVVEPDTEPLRVITAPSSSNPNLKAQQGVFTLLSDWISFDKAGNFLPFEQVIQKIADNAGASGGAREPLSECMLRKFTLISSEAPRLLYLLSKLDITPSTVYPGYESVVHDLRMRKDFHDRGYV